MPELLKNTDVEPVYVELMTEASSTVFDVDGILTAVEESFANPGAKSESRKAVAGEMFYKPGTATSRAITEMYDVIQLGPQTVTAPK